MQITYKKAARDDIGAVTDLLCLVYKNHTRGDLLMENERHFADADQAFFLALDGEKPVGVTHGSIRHEYVNGANDGRKGYLEGIYVLPEYRLRGIAAALAGGVERWAASRGCREFASDCLLDNTDSYSFHLRIGFAETERCIFFLKTIG